MRSQPTLQPDAGNHPHALPFGAVMATAGAAAVAAPCGLGWLITPLLVVAVAQAAWITTASLLPHRHAWRAARTWLCKVRHPGEHSGAHTVPLGLAIIAGAFAGFGSASARPGVAAWLSAACLLSAWLAGGVCVGRFGAALARRPWRITDVDGTWFLVPAVSLGLAAATAGVAAHATGALHAPLAWLALAAGIAGWFGYWLVAAAAARRVVVRGLGPPPRASWWIAMGCAGLAAAALGKVLDAATWPAVVHAFATPGVLLAAIAALALALPVAWASLRFLWHDCRCRDAAAWPPTFSTAVLALGCLAASGAWDSGWLRALGVAGGYATLVLWAATLGWNLWRRMRNRP